MQATVEATRQQFQRWIEEGQHLMMVLPGLVELNERLSGELTAATRLRERLQRELADLNTENNALRGERAETQDTFSKFMNDIQLLVNDVVQNLHVLQKGRVSEQQWAKNGPATPAHTQSPANGGLAHATENG